jgi:hypothetical protein
VNLPLKTTCSLNISGHDQPECGKRGNIYQSETDEERSGNSKHTSIQYRTRIKSLSAKSYDSLPGISSLDFVLLFIPIEASDEEKED